MKQLFKVICRGMQQGPHHHGVAYVVADDASEAYSLLRQRLDRRDLGFDSDRALLTVEVIAGEGEYPECGHQLLISEAR